MDLKNKKLYLLDMDGTIYIDNVLIDGALDFLSAVKECGGRYVFLTNNSAHSVEKYIKKLRSLNIEAGEDDFFTSSMATARYLLKTSPDKKIYVFGTESLKEELSKNGLNITDELSDDIDLLLLGYDTELTYKKLEDSCILLRNDIAYVATHPDFVCPTWYGGAPDCGSVIEMLYTATGKRPIVIGKPQPEMALLAMEKFGIKKEETVLIGDRMYTDIACGNNAGIDTILVMSGETTEEIYRTSPDKPTYKVESVKSLIEYI